MGGGAPPQRLGLGGNSAGAAIAASAALHLRDSGAVRLRHLDLEVPVASLHPVGESAARYAAGFGLDDVGALFDLYVGPDGAADAYASVAEVEDLTGLPPTLISVAEHDPLRDSGVLLSKRLRDAGVPVVLVLGRGQLHSSSGITAVMPDARRWQHRHAIELRRAYRTDPAPAGS